MRPRVAIPFSVPPLFWISFWIMLANAPLSILKGATTTRPNIKNHLRPPLGYIMLNFQAPSCALPFARGRGCIHAVWLWPSYVVYYAYTKGREFSCLKHPPWTNFHKHRGGGLGHQIHISCSQANAKWKISDTSDHYAPGWLFRFPCGPSFGFHFENCWPIFPSSILKGANKLQSDIQNTSGQPFDYIIL